MKVLVLAMALHTETFLVPLMFESRGLTVDTKLDNIVVVLVD